MPRPRKPRRQPERHDHDGPCDCQPRPVIVTVTITDAAGDVRAVRVGETFVRPHRRHHGPGPDDWE